jgi:hypothetical protein
MSLSLQGRTMRLESAESWYNPENASIFGRAAYAGYSSMF